MAKREKDSRTYDVGGFVRRAACLCFKDETEKEIDIYKEKKINMLSREKLKAEILLISSSEEPHKWVIPGGGIEPFEEPSDAARREAVEEAGTQGQLGRYLGQLENSNKKKRTYLYVLIVNHLLEEWKEQKSIDRKRKWFSLEEAKQQLSQKQGQAELLDLLFKTNSSKS